MSGSLKDRFPDLAQFTAAVREAFGEEQGGRLREGGELLRAWGVCKGENDDRARGQAGSA